MHINVRDILAEDLGYNRTFTISGEEPTLESVILKSPIEGQIQIAKLEAGLLVEGEISTEIELECHRCLRTFTRPTTVRLHQVFSEKPYDDQLPIEDDQIDLAPLLQQEIIVNLPIKILDRDDCPGIELPGSDQDDSGGSFTNHARITKGS